MHQDGHLGFELLDTTRWGGSHCWELGVRIKLIATSFAVAVSLLLAHKPVVELDLLHRGHMLEFLHYPTS
jgi:hypothetical protein